MRFCHLKCLLVAAFSLFSGFIFAQDQPGETGKPKKATFNANEVIFGHVLDAHEFHFLSYKDGDGKEHAATIPLPVILYSPQRGVSGFMSSKFHHGEEDYKGYSILTEEKIHELKLDPKKYHVGQVVGVNNNGEFDPGIDVYDFSVTRNVVQMILALALLVWVMLSIAKKYKNGEGVLLQLLKGKQSLLEPVILFIKDEVAKPNLGHRYQKYLPYLLTRFLFYPDQ